MRRTPIARALAERSTSRSAAGSFETGRLSREGRDGGEAHESSNKPSRGMLGGFWPRYLAFSKPIAPPTAHVSSIPPPMPTSPLSSTTDSLPQCSL